MRRALTTCAAANRCVEKLDRFVKFKPQTPLREIIRLTAGNI